MDPRLDADVRQARQEAGGLRAAIRPPDQGTVESGYALVGRTFSMGNYPNQAQRVYACRVRPPRGRESEGSPGEFESPDQAVFALNLGGTVPPVDTYVLLTLAGGRWVFRHG